MNQRADRHRLRIKLALLFCSLIASLFIAEIFLRLIRYAPQDLHLFRENPHRTGSYRLRSNLDVVTRLAGKNSRIKTNSHGMRWREIAIAPDAGKKRIAFVGDSFTFGLWADTVEQSFVGEFERGAANLEALNFGVPGFGFTDMELLIREQIISFQPRTIVLVSYNGNDFLDTYLGLDRYRVASNGVLILNRKVLEEKIPAEFRRSGFKFRRSLAENFYLTRLLQVGWKTVFPRQLDAARADTSYSSNLFWSQQKYPQFAQAAKDISLDTLARIHALCQQNSVELRIVTMPSLEQLNFPEALIGEYRKELPQAYVNEFAAGNSIPFLDLLPELEERANRDRVEIYNQSVGHLTNEGHRAVGQLLREFFENDVP